MPHDIPKNRQPLPFLAQLWAQALAAGPVGVVVGGKEGLWVGHEAKYLAGRVAEAGAVQVGAVGVVGVGGGAVAVGVEVGEAVETGGFNGLAGGFVGYHQATFAVAHGYFQR